MADDDDLKHVDPDVLRALDRRDADIADLKARIAEIERKIDAMTNPPDLELEALKDEVARLTDRVAEAEQGVEQAKGRVEEAMESTQALDKLYTDVIDLITATNDNIAELSEASTTTTALLSRLDARVTVLEAATGDGDGDGDGNGEPPPPPPPGGQETRSGAIAAALAALVATGPIMGPNEAVAIQARLDAGEVVRLADGNYGNRRFRLDKNGSGLVASNRESKAVVFDRGGASGPTIYGNGSNCWVVGLVIKNNATGKQEGAIHPNNDIGGGPAFGWRVVDCDVSDNGGRGITTCRGGQIVGCRVWRNGGNCGISGSGECLIEWNDLGQNNPTNREIHWDAAAIKVTFGRSNQNIATGYGMVIRCNLIRGQGGSGIWCDWDGRVITVERNTVSGCTNSAVIIECCSKATVRWNWVGHNCTRYFDQWVRAMNAEISCQNSPEFLCYGNVIVASRGEPCHITQQCRTGSGDTWTPQGGPGFGWFVSRDGLWEKNEIYDLGNDRSRKLTTMYVDKPGVIQADRSKTGIWEPARGRIEGTTTTQCRVYPPDGKFPEKSAWHDGIGGGKSVFSYAFIPPHTAEALKNTWRNNSLVTGRPEPDWTKIPPAGSA